MEADRRPRRGIVFILSAPSGAGKTTLSRAVLGKIDGLEMSVSLTTRAPRAGSPPPRDLVLLAGPFWFAGRIVAVLGRC